MKNKTFFSVFSKFMVTSLILGGLSAVPFINNETNNNDKTIVTKASTTDVTLTLDSTTLTFKGGQKTLSLPAGTKLTLDNFDTVKSPDGRTLAGFSVVKDGKSEQCIELEKFVVPTVATTIKPYFGASEGFTQSWFYKGKTTQTEHQFIGGNNTFNHFKTLEMKKSVLIERDGFDTRGTRLVDKSYVSEHSAVRLTTPDVDNVINKMDNNIHAIEFKYHIINYSATESLHLDLYQINGSSELNMDSKHTQYNYEKNRARIDVDLAPGESKDFTLIEDIGHNGNALSLFVADQDMKKGMDFGYDFEFRRVDKKLAYKVTPEINTKAYVDLILPEGMTLDASYKTEGKDTDPFIAPTEDQIHSKNGLVVKGWKESVTKAPVSVDTRLRKSRLKLEPILGSVDEMGRILIKKSNSRGHLGADLNYKFDGEMEEVKVTNVTSGFESGSKITLSKPVAANSVYKHEAKGPNNEKWKGKTTYIFDHTVKNNGTEDLELEIFAKAGGGNRDNFTKETSTSGVYKIPAGATRTLKIFHTVPGDDNNTFVWICVRNNVQKLDIDVFSKVIQENTNYVTERLRTDVGMKYKFSKSSTLNRTLYSDFRDVRVYVDAKFDSTLLNKATESGILFTTNTEFTYSKFNKTLKGINLIKNIQKKETFTLKIEYPDYKAEMDSEFLVTPYYIVNGMYYTGYSTITNLREVARNHATLEGATEIEKAAIQDFIK